MVQLDSVNVAVRTHYMPAFSRLGSYPRERLDAYAYGRRRLFEAWGHAASLLPVEHYPLLRHRMEDARSTRSFGRERRAYVEEICREVAERGPLAVSDLRDQGSNRSRPWWGRSDGKLALEWLFATGRLAASRRGNFMRVYDLAERVIPPEVLAAPAPATRDAQRELLRLAARAHGIGDAADLADYYRIRVPQARPLLRELVEAGDLVDARVEGWDRPAYLHRDARVPRRIGASALLSPFDSLIWRRERTERLFGFHYRIEIYVPEPERQYGYYVFPFLAGDTLAARVDLKADRARGALLVRGAYLEEGCDAGAAAGELATNLHAMAAWLALGEVKVGTRGSLAAPLRRAVG
ncbi:MAG: winged helix DNA-binding domain-containing protein [Spirochaetaceae bacterium]|nr:winged helix DNA-binding domain-containing protein [Spirochaetaceae bacterium]